VITVLALLGTGERHDERLVDVGELFAQRAPLIDVLGHVLGLGWGFLSGASMQLLLRKRPGYLWQCFSGLVAGAALVACWDLARKAA
jgi:hypothetical protein